MKKIWSYSSNRLRIVLCILVIMYWIKLYYNSTDGLILLGILFAFLMLGSILTLKLDTWTELVTITHKSANYTTYCYVTYKRQNGEERSFCFTLAGAKNIIIGNTLKVFVEKTIGGRNDELPQELKKYEVCE